MRVLCLVALLSLGVGGCGKDPVAPTPVVPPVIMYFTATPLTIPLGATTTLSWDVASTGATCTIMPLIGDVPCSGSKAVAPSATTEFTLSANNGLLRMQKTTVVVR